MPSRAVRLRPTAGPVKLVSALIITCLSAVRPEIKTNDALTIGSRSVGRQYFQHLFHELGRVTPGGDELCNGAGSWGVPTEDHDGSRCVGVRQRHVDRKARSVIIEVEIEIHRGSALLVAARDQPISDVVTFVAVQLNRTDVPRSIVYLLHELERHQLWPGDQQAGRLETAGR